MSTTVNRGTLAVMINTTSVTIADSTPCLHSCGKVPSSKQLLQSLGSVLATQAFLTLAQSSDAAWSQIWLE